MTIERRYNGGFKVYLNDELIDTVFWSAGSKDEVTRSLIGHDGYDSGIVCVPPLEGIIPLTEKELESLCDDNEVRLVQATEPEVLGRWDWVDDDGGNASDTSFDTKEDAMRDAVATLDLDTNGDEDDAK